MINPTITDAYIPSTSTWLTLRRLTLPSIIEILRFWEKFPETQTNKPEELAKFFKRCETKIPTRKYITDKIIHLYPKGLNMLQISLLETQMIFETPNITWRRSNVGRFLNINSLDDLPGALRKELSRLYMNHIHFTRNHDGFLVLRVQLFEIEKINCVKSQSSIFFVIPQNSNYIIHNSTKIFEIDLILQIFSKLLSTTVEKSMEIVKDLHSILKQSSKDRVELGVWNIYNQPNRIDISPFDDLAKHHSLIDRSIMISYQEKIKELSWLRFKAGPRPKELYGDENFDEYYASDIKFHSKQYRIKDIFTDPKSNKSTEIKINLRIKGNDVFAGLHEMADLGLLNIEKIPGYLTGEDGLTDTIIQEVEEVKCVTTIDRVISNGSLI